MGVSKSALAIRMRQLHLLGRDDLKDHTRLSMSSVTGTHDFEGGRSIMPRYNVREENPIRYAQVKAEQEKLRAECAKKSSMTLARLCPYCEQ